MTAAQEIARDYLSQYRRALSKLTYEQHKYEKLIARAEGVGSSLGFPRGKTGETIREELKNRNGLKRMTNLALEVPLPSGKYHYNTKEEYLANLADQSVQVDKVMAKALEISKAIERTIDVYCPNQNGLVLKYRYITLMTFEEIAKTLKFSRSHIYKMHSDGLHHLGIYLQKAGKSKDFEKDNNFWTK